MKKIPHFKSEAAEREFWERHDSTEYIAWSEAEKVVFPRLSKSPVSTARGRRRRSSSAQAGSRTK